MSSFRFLRFALSASAVALLTGCNILPEPQPDNARFYVLESSTGTAPTDAKVLRLGLRRVDIPGYLKSKTVVTRRGDNELRYEENARWAEPLEAGIMRALRDHLSAHAAVSVYPFPTQVERDYDVSVQVTAAEGREDSVRFSATFEVVRVSDSQVVARRSFRAPAAEWGGDPARLAAQLSVAVGGLAQEIVTALPTR